MKFDAMTMLASALALRSLPVAAANAGDAGARLPVPAQPVSHNPASPANQRGSRNFLLSRQCEAEAGDSLVKRGHFFPSFSASDPACHELMLSLETDLTASQKQEVAATVRDSRLVHKNTIDGMRKKLANFPVAQDSLLDKKNLAYHPAVCTSIITDTPLVTTFNWREQLFYGLLLDPQNMVPVLTSHRNLWSDDCAYEVDKWTDRTPTEQGRKPQWNWRPVANAAPGGELCHDMDVATHMAARDIALKEGGHDSLRDKEILTFNEVNVVQKPDASGPLSKGMFIDFVSNDFVYLLRKPKYKSLLKLSQLVPMERWVKAMQAVNFDFLKARQEEFSGAKALCQEHHLPFFIRSINEKGVVGFREVDLREVDSLDDLARLHPVLAEHTDPLLKPLVNILKALVK